jgi:hypothetical protein
VAAALSKLGEGSPFQVGQVLLHQVVQYPYYQPMLVQQVQVDLLLSLQAHLALVQVGQYLSALAPLLVVLPEI